MSAGDALFIGWTGTSPMYKELEPDISYEPIREGERKWPTGQTVELPVNYVRTRVTRRLICFSSQKSQVISNLGFDNQTLTLTYLNTSGATETQSLGAGWQMGTISDSSYRKGYSLITVTYEKIQTRGLTFGLPENFTVTCTNGVASFKYLTKTLESFDSGDGVCREGIYILGRGYTIPALATIANVQYPTPLDSQAINSAVFASAEIYVNKTMFERIEILGSDIQTRQYPYYIEEMALEVPEPGAGTEVLRSMAAQKRADWFSANALTDDQKQDIIDAYRVEYPDTAYTSYQFDVIETRFGAVTAVYSPIINPDGTQGSLQVTGYDWEAYVTRTLRRRETYNIPEPAFEPKYYFEKSGNVITLYFADRPWKQYDVTGIT